MFDELPQLWGVVGQDDQLGLAEAQSLECLSVAEHVLARLDDQLESVVDVLHRLFLFIFVLFESVDGRYRPECANNAMKNGQKNGANLRNPSW